MTWRPGFRTRIRESVSGSEVRASDRVYPKHKLNLAFEFLRSGADQELQKIVGLFLANHGAFDTFLISHPEDNAVTDQLFGIRDGVTTQYLLNRTFGAGGFTFIE